MADKRAQRVRIDAICNAVRRGEYDDKLSDLQTALDERRKELQNDLLARVKEVYGEDFAILPANQQNFVPRGGENPRLPQGVIEDPDLHGPIIGNGAPEADEDGPKGATKDDKLLSDPDYESRSPQISGKPPWEA